MPFCCSFALIAVGTLVYKIYPQGDRLLVLAMTSGQAVVWWLTPGTGVTLVRLWCQLSLPFLLTFMKLWHDLKLATGCVCSGAS